MPKRAPPLAINTRIDACEIKEVLQSDAFGHRYFAWDESLSAWVVVLEFLPEGLAERSPDGGELRPLPEEETTFHYGLQEFVELGEILHRHASTGLERVLKLLSCHGTAYWLLEPVEGASLSEFLHARSEPLGERDIIRLAHHLLVALAALHREHLYHLAVAPEQIFLSHVDHPVLCGVAMARYKLAERLGAVDEFRNPAFSAPELGQPESASAQADLFGLGACLYYAITRRYLSPADGGLPHYTQVERGLYSNNLLQIVGMLANPSRDARYTSVLEALQALARLTAQEGKKPPRVVEHHYGPELVVAPQSRPWRWAITGAMLACLVLASGYWLNRRPLTSFPPPGPAETLPVPTPAPASRPAPAETGQAVPARAPPTTVDPAAGRRVFLFSDPLRIGGSGPEMALVPEGQFLMGDAKAVGQSSEVPVHRVIIQKRFALSRFELSFEDFDRYASATGRPRPHDEGWGRGRRPVINVSYNDIIAYLDWLKEQTGKPYRLPTEAEWEYSARAGAKGLHTWGDKTGIGHAVCDGCGSEWDFTMTAPVGSFAPNAFGLYDMQGNVSEWVQDCWTPDFSEAPTDGSARLQGNCGFRVWRGGSWSDLPRALRLSARTSYPRDYRSNQAGFRVAVDL